MACAGTLSYYMYVCALPYMYVRSHLQHTSYIETSGFLTFLNVPSTMLNNVFNIHDCSEVKVL